MSDRSLVVKVSAQVAEYKQGMLEAAKVTHATGSEIEKLQQKRDAFNMLGTAAVGVGTAMVAMSVFAAKAAMDWGSAWAGVTKTVDGTPEQLAEVESGLRGLTSVLPAAHNEIASVAEAAGQLGIETKNVVAFTKTMIDLGETTNLSANDAATSLARFTNIMGTSQSDVSNLGSALVGLGNNYATTEAEIMAMSMRLAGAGKQIGMTEGDVLGLAAALSSVGIDAEAGGSAMSKVMIDIAAAVENGGAKLDKFASAAGVSAMNFATQWKTAPAQALATFVKGLGNAESQGKSTLGILEDLGITEVRMRDALLRSSSAAHQFAGAMSMGNEEFEKNNALVAEAAKRYETVESKLKIAGNAVNDAAISFGSVLLPAVAKGAEAVADMAGWLAGLPEPVQGIITVLSSTAGAAALVGGAALLAVPKIAAFRIALEELNVTGSKSTGRMATFAKVAAGAAAGMAIAKVGADLLTDALANIGNSAEETQNKLATAANGADVFAAAMGRGFGSTDDIEKSTQALSGLSEMLDRSIAGKQGLDDAMDGRAVLFAVDAVSRLKVQLSSLAESNLPVAQRQFRILAEDAGLSNDQILELLDMMPDYKRVLTETATELDMTSDSQALVNLAMGEAGDASGIAADGMTDIERASEEAAAALTGMAGALADVAGEAMNLGEAKDRALAAINALTDASNAEGAAIDGTNDASIRLRDSIRDVETAHRDSAEAIINAGGTLEDATAEWDKGRDAVLGMLKAKGMDDAAAIAWADQQSGSASKVKASIDELYRAWLNLPENRETKYRIEADEAMVKLQNLKDRLAGIPSYKRITLEGFTVGKFDVTPPGHATGGPIFGPGSGTSDSIPRMLSNGEHVITAAEVRAAGGHGQIEAWRGMVLTGGSRTAENGPEMIIPRPGKNGDDSK